MRPFRRVWGVSSTHVERIQSSLQVELLEQVVRAMTRIHSLVHDWRRSRSEECCLGHAATGSTPIGSGWRGWRYRTTIWDDAVHPHSYGHVSTN